MVLPASELGRYRHSEGGRAERLANRVLLAVTLNGNRESSARANHFAIVARCERFTVSTFIVPRGEETAVNTETSYGTQQRL